MATPSPNCLRFDRDTRGIRLQSFGLSERELELAKSLHALITTHKEALTSEFYAGITSDPRLRAYIQAPGLEERLHRTMLRYVGELGIGFTSPAYFESRLRVGTVHRKIGLPLPIYHANYARLQSVIACMISREVADATLRAQLLSLAIRVTALDMSLATEAYNAAHLDTLEVELTTLRSEEEELRRLVDTDALTGVASRAHVLGVLERHLAQPDVGTACVHVLMVDVDHFKAINDSHGHPVGDEVLKQISGRIKASLRDCDLVGRYGGEEFLVVLETRQPSEGREIAERVRTAVSGQPIGCENISLTARVSVGMTQACVGEAASVAVERADRALYAAKRAGRDQTVSVSAVCGDRTTTKAA